MKRKSIRGYLLAGLIVWLPILATMMIIRFIVELLDQTVALLPSSYQPEQLFGINIPGFGVLLSLLVFLLTGIVASNILGERLVRWSEKLLDKIPLVRSVYGTSKQVIQSLFGSNSNSFRSVLLVEYPRKGMWSLAFQTGVAGPGLDEHTGAEMVTVFIPTTPNPTSGFLILVPKAEILELAMSTDEALKFIISLGMMGPSSPSAFQVKHQ